MKINVTELENSEVRIDSVLEAEILEKHRDEVTKELVGELEIDGFRKGKVPHDQAMKYIHPMKVYEEMAHHAIWDAYPAILKETNIQAIGNPSIAITKITDGSDLEFSITTAVMPVIDLGDYKKIAKEVQKEDEDTTVEQKELDEVILNLRKMRAQGEFSKNEKENEVIDADNVDADSLGTSESETPSWNDIKEEDLPEIDDAWISTIGPFKTVEEFMDKMKSNLEEEKKAKSIDKRRIALIDGILDTSKIDVPKLLVDYETDKMMHEFEHSIAMTGMKFEDYLASIDKTREDYKEAWYEQAKKRAQTELMLTQITKLENLQPEESKVEEEVKKIMDQYQANPHIDENAVRAYVTNILSHQGVFEYLETLK